MTRRQRLEAVINGEITEELIESCREELEKLNAQGAGAELTENQKKNAEIGEVILQILADGSHLQIEAIMAQLQVAMSRQKVTAICTNLIREGRLKSEDVKVSGKGKRKAYYI